MKNFNRELNWLLHVSAEGLRYLQVDYVNDEQMSTKNLIESLKIIQANINALITLCKYEEKKKEEENNNE